VTVVPALCSLLIRGPFHQEDRNWIMRGMMAVYEPVLDWALQWRKTVILGALMILIASQVVAWGLPREWQNWVHKKSPQLASVTQGFGREFMPP
ncbi:MAG TPA: hypothetical protein DCY13_20360, partial [Verrucomicrobiales bacterium]|nr:hypothetical protein [Verrucomicrobiales bacterium]